MQHTDVFQELFQAIKEEAILISDQVSQNEECENMEERFAIFHYENKGDFGDYSILLKNIRIIKDIVEKGLIVSKLNDICSKKGFLYNKYKAMILRETTIQIKEEDKAIRNYFLHSNVYPEPKAISPFYDLDITLSYNEWKNISFIKDKLNHIACYSCVSELMSKTFEQLPYEVFKSLYYIYYGVYDGALVNDVTTKIKNGDTPDILFLEENKDIREYLNDIENIKPDNDIQFKIEKIQKQSSDVLIKNTHTFTPRSITILAENLIKSGYIKTEDKNIFTGLFYANETTCAKNRRIIWYGSLDMVKILFKVIFSNKNRVPQGTHNILSEVFVTNDGGTNAQLTFSNKDYGKLQKKYPTEYKIIYDIVNNAKMYKGA